MDFRTQKFLHGSVKAILGSKGDLGSFRPFLAIFVKFEKRASILKNGPVALGAEKVQNSRFQFSRNHAK